MLPQSHLPKQQNVLHLAQSKGKCTDIWMASLPLRHLLDLSGLCHDLLSCHLATAK